MRPHARSALSARVSIVLLLLPVAFATAHAADAAPGNPPPAEDWSLHGQSTVVEQGHGTFHSPYAGLNSLSPRSEDKHTITITGFAGRRLWPGGELYYDPEMSQGTGVSETVGMAGFPNGEATRAGAHNLQYNTARLFVRQTFGFGGGNEEVEGDANQLPGERDVERVTVTIGKMSASDQFDGNRYSHDPRTQFLNWALMENGAWDYPADTKGYTGGATVEWNSAQHAVRWGAFMEPKEANGRPLDPRLSRALGQVIEWEQRYTANGRSGAFRVLAFWNKAHMGSYSDALRLPVPDVTATRRYRSKVGLGANWEQEITENVGLFARAGLNDGRTESWAFTEIDRTLSGGISVRGKAWGRADDTLGLAGVVNGLAPRHRRYLAAGGYGFIAGDGRLRYGTEQILEGFYALQIAKWLGLTLDAQLANRPAYNRDRGPVAIFAARSHMQF